MNNAALDAAIDWAAAHPETHKQDRWRNADGMCIAGILCHLDPDTEFYSAADDESLTFVMPDGDWWLSLLPACILVKAGGKLTTVSMRAAQILELPESATHGAVSPFYGLNSLGDIRVAAAKIQEEVHA